MVRRRTTDTSIASSSLARAINKRCRCIIINIIAKRALWLEPCGGVTRRKFIVYPKEGGLSSMVSMAPLALLSLWDRRTPMDKSH